MTKVYLYIEERQLEEQSAEDTSSGHIHVWQHETAHKLLAWAKEQPDNQKLPCHNITHSGKLVAVALSDHAVGVDGEVPRHVSERIADRVLTEQELEFLSGAPDQNMAFLQLWTLKESYGKALGVGIAYPMKDVSLVPRPNRDGEIWQRVYCSESGMTCFSLKRQDYVLALSVHGMAQAEREPVLIILQKRVFL